MKRILLSFLLVALTALTATAQHVLLDEIASFKPPFTIVEGALAETADGSVYGLYVGGTNGGIYRVRPNGAGGYVTTVVYEFGAGTPSPTQAFRVNGSISDLIEAGPDGRIYFANHTALLRFDPAAASVETLHALPDGFPTSVVFSADGHSVYGTQREGLLYSYDTATSQYREVARLGTNLSGLQEMTDGSLIAVHDGMSNTTAIMNRVDPLTGAVTAQIVRERSVMLTPSKGDDGAIYVQTSEFGDRVTSRVEVSCFCLQELYRIPWPNNEFSSTLAGARNGYLYINYSSTPVRINLNVTPPVAEPIALGNAGINYRILSNGTMLLTTFDANSRPIVNAVDINTLTPGGTVTVMPFTTAPTNDGLGGFPDRFTEAADGALYGVSATGNRFGPIFRIDPITRSRAIVAEIDFGQDRFNISVSVNAMVAGADGLLYGTYIINDTGNSAIFRFDPTTNTVSTLKEFPLDPVTGGAATADGGYVAQLWAGGDGWIYGGTWMGQEAATNFSGSLFKFDPATGQFITIARPVLPFGFYPFGAMAEASPGVWYLVYYDNVNYCGSLGRLDAASGEFTTVINFDETQQGCSPAGLMAAPGGGMFVHLGGGPQFSDGTYGYGAIYRLDPATHALTLVRQFLSTDVFPGRLVAGADGKLYGTYFRWVSSNESRHGLFRIDPATGAMTELLETTSLAFYLASDSTITSDGRIIVATILPYRAYAVAVLDAIAVAPATGPVDGTTSASAKLEALGVPMAGVTIDFTLNGDPIGSAITNAQGVATLENISLDGVAIGTHANAIGASFSGNDRFPATSGSGSLTVIDVPTPGLAVGVGHLRDGERKIEFAYAVLETTNGSNAGAFELEVKMKKSRDRFTSTSITSMRLGDGTVMFSGSGKWNGATGYRFDVVATESEGRFRGALRVTVTNSAGNVLLTIDDQLQGGVIESLRLRR